MASFGLLAEFAGKFEGVADVGAVLPDSAKFGFGEFLAGDGIFRTDDGMLGLGCVDMEGKGLIDGKVDGFIGDEGFAVEMGFDGGHAGTSEGIIAFFGEGRLGVIGRTLGMLLTTEVLVRSMHRWHPAFRYLSQPKSIGPLGPISTRQIENSSPWSCKVRVNDDWVFCHVAPTQMPVTEKLKGP